MLPPSDGSIFAAVDLATKLSVTFSYERRPGDTRIDVVMVRALAVPGCDPYANLVRAHRGHSEVARCASNANRSFAGCRGRFDLVSRFLQGVDRA